MQRSPGTGQYAGEDMRYALLLILLLRGNTHDLYVNALYFGLAMWNDV